MASNSSDGLPGRMRSACAAVPCKELEMSILMRFTALAVTMTAALFISQPSQAITPIAQPNLMFAHGFSPDSLVTTVARRGGYGGRSVYRGRGVHRGGVYRGRGVYRGGVYRGGVYRGGVYRRAGIGYGAMCGYAPYPPCAVVTMAASIAAASIVAACIAAVSRTGAVGYIAAASVAAVHTGRIEEAVGDKDGGLRILSSPPPPRLPRRRFVSKVPL